jgi:hypothetical protein
MQVQQQMHTNLKNTSSITSIHYSFHHDRRRDIKTKKNKRREPMRTPLKAHHIT